MDIHPRGSFGKAALVSFTDHDWGPANFERTFMGLSPAGQHISGSLLVDGRRLVPIRQLQNELAVRFVNFAGTEGEDLAMVRPKRSYVGYTELDERDGLWGWWEPDRDEGFAYAVGGAEMFWREPGTIEIHARAIGQAHQFVVPDADEPLAYQVRYFVLGGCDGSPVTGLIAHEQVYMPPGRGWFSSAYLADLEQIWVAFFTQFADGQTVHGQILIGREHLRMAAIQESAGWSLATPRLVCDRFALDANGFADRVEFELEDGSRWVFRPRKGDGGRLLLGASTPTWREGVVTRSGETRDVVFAHTWMELFPERLTDPDFR